MIQANLATYPPRREAMLAVVESIAPQVDRLNVVLNQYDSELPELTKLENVRQVVPDRDTKDTGKFYPDVSEAEIVLTLDDDISYPAGYVAQTVAMMRTLGPGHVGTYHGSLYYRPTFGLSWKRLTEWISYSDRKLAAFRVVHTFYHGVEQAIVVDQPATGVAAMFTCDFPPFDFMKDSQKFVDVRLSRWAFERGLKPVLLPRPAGWLSPVRFEETIYESFTKSHPQNVNAEIAVFARKVPGRGESLDLSWVPQAAT